MALQNAHEAEGVDEMVVETTSNNMETGEKMNVMTDMGIFFTLYIICVINILLFKACRL